MSTKTFKTIAVDMDNNYQRLVNFGQVPDSFNQIIGRLLDEGDDAKQGKNW